MARFETALTGPGLCLALTLKRIHNIVTIL